MSMVAVCRLAYNDIEIVIFGSFPGMLLCRMLLQEFVCTTRRSLQSCRQLILSYFFLRARKQGSLL